jgi:hypothetical protein
MEREKLLFLMELFRKENFNIIYLMDGVGLILEMDMYKKENLEMVFY